MRQLSLLVATTVAFFIMLSLFLMSRTATLHSTSLEDEYTTTAEASKSDQIAMQASGTSLDLMETAIAIIQPVTGEHPVIPAVTHGRVIMPSLGNETLKAELGRASWKLFHTILSRFPEQPTLDEREALKSYIHLFARLYPCGECAEHFQGFLAANPPQTSSREAASQWGCHIHNKVNESLNKKIFDCSTIAELYKCGCDDEKDGKDGAKKPDSRAKAVDIKSGDTDTKETLKSLEFHKDGLTRGG